MRFLSRKNDNMGKMKKASIIIALAYALGIILPFSSAKAEKVQYWAKYGHKNEVSKGLCG